MRIATWNIGGGFISSQKNHVYDIEDIAYFIDELKKIDPDVVCLQEVHISEGHNQAEMIAHGLGFEYFETQKLADSHLVEGEDLSLAILSRFPILKRQFHQLTNPKLTFTWRGREVLSHDKGFLECLIQSPESNVSVLCAHMIPFRKFGKDFCSSEFDVIRNEVELIMCSGEVPKILGADMNYADVGAALPKVFERGFKMVLPDTPTTPKGRKYDKIIVSEQWSSKESQIVPGRADHYLGVAELVYISK